MFDQLKDQNPTNPESSEPASVPSGQMSNDQPGQLKPDLKEARRELDDIFNDVSPSAPAKPPKPSVFMPKTRQAAAKTPPGKSQLHKLVVPLVAVAGLALAVVGGYFGYRYVVTTLIDGNVIDKQENETVQTADENVQPAVEGAPIAPDQPAGEVGPVFAETAPDSDADGLTDADEAALGTNSQQVDTDEDGLFDREEARVFKTDPLDADTDKDGFSDGNEVRDGYNPNGAGRLYEVKKE